MALLHPFNFFAAAHPFAGAFAHHPLFDHLHRSFDEREPDVVETDDGFLLSAHVPGVNAADIAIKLTAPHGAASATLTVKGPAEMNFTFLLPAARADLANVAASCIDGILRVAVPKMPVAEHSIPVAAALPSTNSDADNNNDGPRKHERTDGEEFTLRVPGFAPSDISVNLKSTGHLVVEGRSERRGCQGSHFKKHIRLARAAAPDRVTAACADGLLTIAVAPSPGDAQLDVPVLAEEPAAAAMEADGDTAVPTPAGRVTLLRQAVPGLAAKDLSVTVKDGVVRASGKADQSAGARCCFRRVAFEARLPAGAAAGSVAASCEHGVLVVTCSSPAAPAEVEVAVSGDRLACLSQHRGKETDAAEGMERTE